MPVLEAALEKAAVILATALEELARAAKSGRAYAAALARPGPGAVGIGPRHPRPVGQEIDQAGGDADGLGERSRLGDDARAERPEGAGGEGHVLLALGPEVARQRHRHQRHRGADLDRHPHRAQIGQRALGQAHPDRPVAALGGDVDQVGGGQAALGAVGGGHHEGQILALGELIPGAGARRPTVRLEAEDAELGAALPALASERGGLGGGEQRQHLGSGEGLADGQGQDQ